MVPIEIEPPTAPDDVARECQRDSWGLPKGATDRDAPLRRPASLWCKPCYEPEPVRGGVHVMFNCRLFYN